MVNYLLLSVLFSSITVSFFKLFELKNVKTFQAIVMNYISCGLIGSLFADHTIFEAKVWTMPWFGFAVVLGFLFISIFFCIGLTAQKLGVSVSMVAAKLSVVIPVLIALFFQGEQLKLLSAGGIVLSLLAVYLMSRSSQSTENTKANKQFIWLPLVVFAGSGAIDTLLNHLNKTFIPPSTADQIVTTIFLNAFVLGVLFLGFQLFTHKESLDGKSLLWGLLLGIPNYFSMYFLVKTLGQTQQASVVFPINNIGIVLLSSLLAFVFFKEKFNQLKLIGLALASIAIVLMAL
jgi:drug/metabolite transporter (DMT)-like permease